MIVQFDYPSQAIKCSTYFFSSPLIAIPTIHCFSGMIYNNNKCIFSSSMNFCYSIRPFESNIIINCTWTKTSNVCTRWRCSRCWTVNTFWTPIRSKQSQYFRSNQCKSPTSNVFIRHQWWCTSTVNLTAIEETNIEISLKTNRIV